MNAAVLKCEVRTLHIVENF